MALPPDRWFSSLMALAMIYSLPPAIGAIDSNPAVPAAPDTDLTPQELIQAADRAYASGDWAVAESRLAALVATYQSIPEMAETVRRAKPLRAVSRLRSRKLDAESLALVEESLTDKNLEPAMADELAFWRGLCHLELGAPVEARRALESYTAGAHLRSSPIPDVLRRGRAGRCAESILLQAACLLEEGAAAEAAAFLGSRIVQLRKQQFGEAAGRATVLRLHALLAADQVRPALDHVRASQPHLTEISQCAGFQMLCLQLGSRLLEDGRCHDAIACFQRIWPRAQIMARQQENRSRLSRRLDGMKRLNGQEEHVLQLESILRRIDREIEAFSKIESFDAALRFRIAAAYRDLGRAREAALVLEDMIARLPADPVIEKAALCLIQCWMQAASWPRATAAADAYLERFRRADNPDVPMVRFLKASALHADQRPHDAELAFAAVHQLHPRHALAARALFLEGMCLLEQELYREALDAFGEALDREPDPELEDDCAYWSAMAVSFDKRHEEARDRFRKYLDRFGERAMHSDDARYRIAFSTFGLAEYGEASKQLAAFITAHGGHALTAEAGLLLGDALGAIGRLDEAVAAYRQIDRNLNVRCFEEAAFRIATVYRQSERPEEMRVHLERFAADQPASPRLAEAVYGIGQSHVRSGRLEEARDVYWRVIGSHGNDPAAFGVDDILLALPKLHAGPEARDALISKLGALAAESDSNRPTLAVRARWARAHMLASAHPEQGRAALCALQPALDVRRHHPRLIADCADALRESGQSSAARTLYLDLRKWHPRAAEKDRAFLGLGLIALEAGKSAEALEFLDRFERETIDSPRRGQAAHLRATLWVKQGNCAEAQREYERVLELPTAPRLLKARTLLDLGDLWVAQNDDLKATAYYERVYVSYAKHRPESATAYARRARALERLNRHDAALEVWRELAGRPELAEFPEAAEARQRITESPPAESSPTESPPAESPRAGATQADAIQAERLPAEAERTRSSISVSKRIEDALPESSPSPWP